MAKKCYCHRSGYTNIFILWCSLCEFYAQLLIQLFFSTGCYTEFFLHLPICLLMLFFYQYHYLRSTVNYQCDFRILTDSRYFVNVLTMSLFLFISCIVFSFLPEETEVINRIRFPIPGNLFPYFLTIFYIYRYKI